MKLSEERLQKIRCWMNDPEAPVVDGEFPCTISERSQALIFVDNLLAHITALEAELEAERDEADCRDEELEEEREGHQLTANRLAAALLALTLPSPPQRRGSEECEAVVRGDVRRRGTDR